MTAVTQAFRLAKRLKTGAEAFTGAICVPDGTEALPSYTFADDKDTGMWSEQDNELNFSTAGTKRISLDGGQFTVEGTIPVNAYQFNAGDSESILQLDATTVLHVGGDISGNNIFFGVPSGNQTKTPAAVDNVGVGNGTLVDLTDGNNNVGMGTDAGANITTGAGNVLIGNAAGINITEATSMMGIGNGALNKIVVGSGCVAIGANALANNTVSPNIAVGSQTGIALSGGFENVLIGHDCLSDGGITNFTSRNVAIGHQALEDRYHASSTSGNNVAIGYRASKQRTTGADNVVIGASADTGAANSSSGSRNVVIGAGAADNGTGYQSNIFIGWQAADSVISGFGNVIIGNDVDVQTTDNSTRLALGGTGAGNADDFLLNIGNLLYSGGLDDDGITGTGTTVSTGYLGIGTQRPTSRLTVNGDCRLQNDNDAMLWGGGGDVEMLFNGSHFLQKTVGADFDFRWRDQGDTNRFAMQITSTGNNQLEMLSGSRTVWFDSSDSDSVIAAHDGTDFNFTSTNTTEYTFDKIIQPQSLRFVPDTQTISTGAISVTQGWHRVDTQGGAGADDLDTVNGGVNGQILILSSVSAARVPTAKDGTGNLNLAGDCILNSPADTLTLLYNSTLAVWVEIARANNA